VFEGLPSLVLFAPMLLPVATAIGINDLQYSIVLILAMGVGAFLPPLGVGYYATCAIVGIAPEKAVRLTVIYKAITTVGIFLIALVPFLTTSVPRAFGFK
jgi:C4-dicarboxylate transporter, DctM subunit